MKNRRFHYIISGYRWAPESFHARKGLTGQPDKEIPLSDEERREVGNLFLAQGYGAAVAYVKQTERERERQRKSIMTYGFRTKENPRYFLYCPHLYCRSDAPMEERLRLFKKVRAILHEIGGQVVTSTQCELDGAYRPINVRENTVAADFDRPLTIPMGKAIVRDGPERPCCPRPTHPKSPTSHKHRKRTPTR